MNIEELYKIIRKCKIIIILSFVIVNSCANEDALVLEINGNISSSKEFSNALEAANHHNYLIVKINSPGGAPYHSKVIFDEIRTAAKFNKTIAYCESICASGGYYIASAADSVYSSPYSIIGSIGVIMAYHDLSGLQDKLGIKYNIISTSKYKTIGTMFKKTEKEGLDYLKRIADKTDYLFKEDVKIKRTIKNKDAFTGKVFLGNEAVELGLIDKVSSFDELLSKNNIKNMKIINLGKQDSFLKRMINYFVESSFRAIKNEI